MARDEKTTVGELRAALAQLPADMRVVVPGVESGYDDVTVVAAVTDVVVSYSHAKDAFNGRHQLAKYPGDSLAAGKPRETVAVLRHG